MKQLSASHELQEFTPGGRSRAAPAPRPVMIRVMVTTRATFPFQTTLSARQRLDAAGTPCPVFFIRCTRASERPHGIPGAKSLTKKIQCAFPEQKHISENRARLQEIPVCHSARALASSLQGHHPSPTGTAPSGGKDPFRPALRIKGCRVPPLTARDFRPPRAGRSKVEIRSFIPIGAPIPEGNGSATANQRRFPLARFLFST